MDFEVAAVKEAALYAMALQGGEEVQLLFIHDLGPRWGEWVLKGDKNTQHAFLRRRSKDVGTCRMILWHVKDPCAV
jgi:hypothetical protein